MFQIRLTNPSCSHLIISLEYFVLKVNVMEGKRDIGL